MNSLGSSKKTMGAHYTPSALAGLLAKRTFERMGDYSSKFVRVLDPACGNGQLLIAAIEMMKQSGMRKWTATGIEADVCAVREAETRLRDCTAGSVHLIVGDFLEMQQENKRHSLLPSGSEEFELRGRFDMVIANPPYVRTQVLGSPRAQRMARRFNLSGRVDLYHAFVIAIANVLEEGGFLGIITSNRFMTTQAGKTVRAFLGSRFELLELIDLGDTKLFDAAVLPAIIIARYRGIGETPKSYDVQFTKAYSEPKVADRLHARVRCHGNIVDAISSGEEGLISLREGVFNITRGTFHVHPGKTSVWSLMSSQESVLLESIRCQSKLTISDVAYVKVGIKTTADNVFVRENWEKMPESQRPEPEMLRPLLRHEDACRWALPKQHAITAKVLYPYEVSFGNRKVVDLDNYPRTLAYLESFRSRLEQRRYLMESGRKWYEIWVPQRPGAWTRSKIVFPDISPEPRFYLVDKDYVVNGDCYWITLRPGVQRDMLYLILAIANSTLMTHFHDMLFGNRLYAGRRRYMSQYVGKYPLPDASSMPAQMAIESARTLVEDPSISEDREEKNSLESRLDAMIYEAFAIDPDGAGL